MDWPAILTVLAALLFTAVPAALGATFGYASGKYGGDVRQSAATTAFQFTFWAMLAAWVLGSMALFVMMLGAESGTMTPLTAWFFISLISLLFVLVMAAVSGALAALGAAIGATRGQLACAVLAGLLAALGAPLGIMLMRYAPDTGRRRHRSELPPRPAIRTAVDLRNRTVSLHTSPGGAGVCRRDVAQYSPLP